MFHRANKIETEAFNVFFFIFFLKAYGSFEIPKQPLLNTHQNQ